MSAGRHDSYAALRLPGLRRYIAGSIITGAAGSAQGLTIGQFIFERTGRPMDLGWFGLVEALAMLAFIFPAGWLADRCDRRRVCQVSLVGAALGSVGLALVARRHGSLEFFYGVLFATAAVRTLGQPARAALLPQIVPRELLENAVTWRSSTGQIATVLGPAVGGFVLAAHGAPLVFEVNAAAQLAFAGLLFGVPLLEVERSEGSLRWQEVTAGVRFVRRTPLLLTVMALDLFAVLLGGAVYLLPVYAEQILRVGEIGLGYLRSADALGALVMALILAHRPPMRHAGRAMLLSVAGFGLATIVFGFSRSMWLSLAMLFFIGVFDNISVVVRGTLIQLLTPDSMRGRVAAVNWVFVGSSNQLGGFESGLVAQRFSPTVSVVAGGIGSILVVLACAGASPKLRRLGQMSEVRAEQA